MISIVLFAIGIYFCAAAARIKKGDLSAIHSYHTKHVAEADRMAYCARMARGMYTMAAGYFLAALCIGGAYVRIGVWLLILSLVLGVWQFYRAQRRYNGGWFS